MHKSMRLSSGREREVNTNMLNKIIIMGRLTADPELRRTGTGVAVTSFTLAVDRDFSPKDGGEKETDFIDCVAWRNTGEFIAKHFTKGRMVVVSGRLQLRSYTDRDGNKRRAAEIVADSVYFGDSKNSSADNSPAPAQDFSAIDISDYELPF